MFSDTPLPLQPAGLCTAWAATAPNIQTYKAAMATDFLRNLENCRPFIVALLRGFVSSPPWSAASPHRRADRTTPWLALSKACALKSSLGYVPGNPRRAD